MNPQKQNRNIKDLQPWMQPYVESFLEQAKIGEWQAFMTEGYRSNERQDWLYAQGRTRTGEVVTFVKGGKSDHNYGRAFDIAFKNEQGSVNWDMGLFKAVAPIWKAMGGKWGGDWWRFRDYPHFYMDKEPDFVRKHKGKIFLQVERKGQAWYVNPKDGKRYSLGSPKKAFKVMEQLGVGVTDKDLSRIPVGRLQ